VPSNGEGSNFVSRSELDILSNREDKNFLSVPVLASDCLGNKTVTSECFSFYCLYDYL